MHLKEVVTPAEVEGQRDLQTTTHQRMMSRSVTRFHLRAKTSSHDNHMLSQVMSPRMCLLRENSTGRA